MSALIIEPAAEADIAQAFDWYEGELEGLGSRFLDAVDAALVTIAQRPESFPVVHRSARRALLRRFPYQVLFELKTQAILVVGVFHTSRDPLVWRERLDQP